MKTVNRETTFGHGIKVGDIYYSSWGYEQTNVDFFLVTRVSAKSIWLVEIGMSELQAESWASATVVPAPERRGEKEYRVLAANPDGTPKRSLNNPTCSIAGIYPYAGHDGVYCSWYA